MNGEGGRRRRHAKIDRPLWASLSPDNSVMPTYYVSKFARTGVTVAVTGDGGDEVSPATGGFYQIGGWSARAQRPYSAVARCAPLGGCVENRSIRAYATRFPATRADEMLGLAGVARYQHLLAFFADAEKEGWYALLFARRAGRSATATISTRARAPRGRYSQPDLYLDLTTYLPEDSCQGRHHQHGHSLEALPLPRSQADRIRREPSRSYKFGDRATQAHPQRGLRPLVAAGLLTGTRRAFFRAAFALAQDDLPT